MNILFHSNQLGIRGTEIALYDMAHYTEKLLGHTSFIAAPADSDFSSFEKFNARFGDRVIIYDKFESLTGLCANSDITHAYYIKGGRKDGKIIPGVKSFVHYVFKWSIEEKHGDQYIAVSKWLADELGTPYLPHIVSLPDVKYNYREHLGIPQDAVVFGRYGGYDQFDVPYLAEVIDSFDRQSYMYFLFMNTKPLHATEHPRIIYLDGTTDLEVKTAFINTCDAMLHGRTEGESFGLAIAEFIHQNKPVITNIEARDRNHIHMLKDTGFYYSSPNELHAILAQFNGPTYIKQYDLKYLIEESRPENVINKFNKMFLKWD